MHRLAPVITLLALAVVTACGAAEQAVRSEPTGAPSASSTVNPSVTVASTPSSLAAPASSSTSVSAVPPTTRPPLPDPSPPIGPGEHGLYVLGDSVILGAQANLPAALSGWDVTFDAQESRFIFRGLDELKGKVSAATKQHDDAQRQAEQTARDAGQPVAVPGPAPTVVSTLGRAVVIHLCTNYEATGAFASWIDKYMDYLRDVDRVVWVTCVEWSKGQVEANAAMRAATTKHANIVIADWAAYARTPGYAYQDGIHLQDAGRRALADLVARAVGPAPSSAASTTTSRR